MPFPHPWFLLGALAAMLGCFVTGEMRGRQAEKQVWELAIARQRIEAAEVLAASETQRAETERAFHELKDKVELDHAAQEIRIEDAYAAHRKLLAERGGLYDIKGDGGRARGCDVLPAGPGAAASDSTAAAGCRLSAEASEALLQLARDADHAAAYAQACRQWAVSIGSIAAPEQ